MKKIILLLLITICFSCKNEVKTELSPEANAILIDTVVKKVVLSDDELKKLFVNTYKDMNEDLGGFERSPSISKDNLETLLEKVRESKYEKKVVKSIDSLNKVIEKNIAENEAIDRKGYETTLRNNFLDNNLNIKVKVSGKNNTRIVMTYSLFNEIWFRKFEKDGHFDALAKKGFKIIELKNGYDYGQGVKYD